MMKNSKAVFFHPPQQQQNHSFVHESGAQDLTEVQKLQRKPKKHNNPMLLEQKQAKFEKEYEGLFQDPFGDEEGFQQSIIEHNAHDDLIDNFGSQMLIMGDDLNKMHKNFAGDTFSQISSTYEQQQPPQLNQGQSQGPTQHKHSKLHQYQEKKPSTNKQTTNDELLDSAILNNLGNDDLNSPKDGHCGELFGQPFLFGRGNQIIDFQQPSAHSNNLCLMMDNLQQSDMQSSVTMYNSGIFDDASIMRILDKSISDESLFLYNNNHQTNSQQDPNTQQSQMRSCLELEQSFKFECEDVKQILVNVSSKLKEKLQKRSLHALSQSQLIALSVEELKQFEILTSSAIEKLRLIQSLGKNISDAQRMKVLGMKNYKQNLRIQLSQQVQKYREAFQKQVKHAERKKIKYQIQEYEMAEKLRGQEDRFQRQAEEINKLANKCEQLKFEKQQITSKYEQKVQQVEQVIHTVQAMLPVESQAKAQKSAAKVNNSFCLGSDHSLLLQPSRKKVKQQDLQQSVDEDKENSSIMSNHQVVKPLTSEIKAYLSQAQQILGEKVVLKVKLQPQQEGGSYFESSSMFNLIGELDLKRDSLIQQSQFVPAESQADINQAFIQSQSSLTNSQNPQGMFINLLDQSSMKNQLNNENDRSLEYKFNEDHILVMDGNRQSKQFLDERISTQDLGGHKAAFLIGDTQRLAQQERLLSKRSDFAHESLDNSVEDDLNMLQDAMLFPVNMSGIDKGNIFIADDCGSFDLNSRNKGSILYSGGSSQLSMMQAFQRSMQRGGGGLRKGEMVVIQVQDRRISMPKLDLKVIAEAVEPYKGNINVQPHMGQSQDSSIYTESQIPESSKTNAMNNQQLNSFQNESVSKQYQSKSLEKESMLDKAICMDGEQSLVSSQFKGDSGAQAPQAAFNMFDSFKQELDMLEQSNHKKQQQQLQSLNKSKPKTLITLDLDEPDDFLPVHKQQKQQQPLDEDKSIDLSLNISKFKKSLSDPNLMFNDVVDSDSDDQPLKAQQSKKKKTSEVPQVQPIQHNNMIAFKKLKTPQNLQSKLKFHIPQADSNGEKDPQQMMQDKRKSLGQFQAKMRTNSSNSRQKEGNTHDTVPIQSNKLKGMIKLQKLSVKGLKLGSVGDKTVIESGNPDQTVLAPPVLHLNTSVLQPQRSDSPDQSHATNPIIKKIVRKSMLKKEIDTQHWPETNTNGLQSENVSQLGKPSLIHQNYMFSAAAMSGASSQIKKGQIKISKGSLGRNSVIAAGIMGNQSQPDIASQDVSVVMKNAKNMMQQMKEYQESQDITQISGVVRQVRVKAKDTNKDCIEDDMVCLSPGKGPQRASQSCTPQKKGKSIIIMSKQVIKVLPKKLNITNIDSTQMDINDQSLMSKPAATISRKKISIIRHGSNHNQHDINQTVVNQSIDQSNMYSSAHHQEEDISQMQLMPDTSMLIQDLSIIAPRIPMKQQQVKMKKSLPSDSTSTQQPNLLSQHTMPQPSNTGANIQLKANALSNNQALFQKLMLQKQYQQPSNYSTQSKGEKSMESQVLDKAYSSNQQPQREAGGMRTAAEDNNIRMQKRRRDLQNRAANNNMQQM